ncbi:MAG: patatin-like phospholipase family protein [Thermonemataceae bacterium]|nr:patatin-like phospholipase family protein [Thermonemataceae bacterium]
MAIKTLDLALQGGGSHGAFTWGVLERLLEDERIEIDGISGTSAGAMNATVFTYGMMQGGRQGAIDLLRKFWKRIADEQKFSLLQPSLFEKTFGDGGKLDYSPMYQMLDFYTLMFSPYQFNPLDYNPLESILDYLIDFEELKTYKSSKLFVCATNVLTGRAKVFSGEEISLKAVMASACLPFLFKAVEIDNEFYWDGGYMGNPPIFPLINDTNTSDILLIQINPINIKDLPRTSDEIRDRINTLSFNTSLIHEMRRVNLIQRLLQLGLDLEGKSRKLNIHHINKEDLMAGMSVSSKLNSDWKFLLRLRDYGRMAAEEWLDKNYEKIGVESTCNLKETFL